MIQFPDLHPFYEKIFKETVIDKEISTKVDQIRCFFEDWAGNFVHPFGNDLLCGNALNDNMFYSYLASQTVIFDWMAHSLLCGAYNIIFRELRTILESLFTVYYLEITFREMSLQDKIEEFKNLEQKGKTHGKQVFTRVGLNNWNENYTLYRELCSYVHLSVSIGGEEIRKVIQDGYGELLDFEYDSESFKKCYDIWMHIARLANQLAVNFLKSFEISILQTPTNFFKEKYI